MNKKGFTLIELLIVISIIGILAGIVIVSLSGSTDNAEDAATKANLRSVATLYAEVFAENNAAPSLCENTKVHEAMNTVFGEVGTRIDGTNTDVDIYTVNAITDTTKDGCVSDSSGEWVVWSELATENEAWCVDSGGKNGQISITDGTTAGNIQNAVLSDGTAISCASIGS